MEKESKKADNSVVSMGEIVRFSFLMTFVLIILEPPPTLWERVLLSTIWICAGILFGFMFRKLKLWQIARAAESQKA